MSQAETQVMDKVVVAEPTKWKVLVLNDDVTPMNFVIAMLMGVFNHDEDEATEITMKVHNDGSAVAGIYDFEVAETKAVDATSIARQEGFPLQLKVVESDK